MPAVPDNPDAIVQSAFAQVLLDGPLAGLYTYRLAPETAIAVGQWVVVPWGKARRVGIVAALVDSTDIAADKLREIEQLLPGLPALTPDWLTFIRFAATYYHGEPAELGLGSVPKLLRMPPSARTRKHADDRLAAFDPAPAPGLGFSSARPAPESLSPDQQSLLSALAQVEGETPPGDAPKPWLLHGVTGSGKTEIYIRWFRHLLDRQPLNQVLLLVPEIGLTPALLSQLRQPVSGRADRGAAQRDAGRGKSQQLDGGGQRPGPHHPRHPAGRAGTDSAPGGNRGRRGARPLVQAAGGNPLLGPRHGDRQSLLVPAADPAGVRDARRWKAGATPNWVAIACCTCPSARAAAHCRRWKWCRSGAHPCSTASPRLP